ncbi:MFS transporter [Roseomonas xinghualingensis]|uniref:MFS transporter n=1 Tax=Roseomonas xinghualingensis TaxID=2986475 RepID=UPI0021F22621|nr:MFS transporter [Roseomonas sp. SXEYE001]MCV4208692.1 MFS transporter [Roseomonas sp. SXEYE001]
MAEQSRPDSAYAWWRLLATVLLATIGGIGLWSIVVALPVVQAEFGVARAGASLPYTLTMLAFMLGGVLMGRLADRFGVILPVLIGTFALGTGYVASAFAADLWQFAALYALFVGGLGSCAVFGPLVADTSLWFTRRRGIAVALCASGNYFAGAVWPPILQHFMASYGWRATHIGIGLFCVVTMLPLALALRRPPPVQAAGATALDTGGLARLGLSPGALQALLMLAGVACCVAMAMPQVHIVAYCADLGYGPARGAEMLSLMLGFGVLSRLISGAITDRIGAPVMLLLGSGLQAVALALFLHFDSLGSLYILSAIFGLFQGGIVPSYAVMIRQFFPPAEAGLRVSLVLSATLAGMALGGWLSGVIFDATFSYHLALVNGIGWNLLNLAIAAWLVLRLRGRPAPMLGQPG